MEPSSINQNPHRFNSLEQNLPIIFSSSKILSATSNGERFPIGSSLLSRDYMHRLGHKRHDYCENSSD
jgi:hypothetical protein